MKPYYQVGNITIYHGNCEELIGLIGQVDLLLTDPPYGIGEAAGKNKSRGKLAIAQDFGNHSWDDRPIDQMLINRLIGQSKEAIMWGGNYYQVTPSSCWLVWDKDNTGDFADCELAWTNLDRAVRKFKYRWNGMLQEHMGRNKEVRVHPTQKPLALMSWCLSLSRTTGTVFDPFMGSGTTLVAAKTAHRSAIGIEQDERYCEIAANRLAQEVFDFGEAKEGDQVGSQAGLSFGDFF